MTRTEAAASQDSFAVAVMAVLRNPQIPLEVLYHPRYLRELRTEIVEDYDGTFLIAVFVPKRGRGTYKRRSPAPRGIPPELDTKRLEAIFTLHLPPSVQIVAVRNAHDRIVIYCKRNGE